MKTLLLVRHAKSSWDYDVEDFDRPLNHRGLTDAPAMAKRLLNKNVAIDAFISSPARRALATATIFAEAFGRNAKSILILPQLYDAPAKTFADVVAGLDNQFDTVALFSHNTGITEFANSLSANKTDDIPTCGVFAVKCDIKKWKDFAFTPRQFWFFDYPKAK